MPAAKPTVLLAEDSFLVASMMRRVVESAGCAVLGPFAEAADAAAAARTGDYDLALLDLALVDETSAATARLARSRGKPVIFITAYAAPEAVPPDLRAVPRLVKPVDDASLRDQLLRSLGHTGG